LRPGRDNHAFGEYCLNLIATFARARSMDDAHDLERFIDAQAFHDALTEVRRGAKRSHWMWFIFPQIAGVGNSPMAQRYAISGLAETRAYLDHPVLGPRLRGIVSAPQDIGAPDKRAGSGSIDFVKLRSSLTLLSRAADRTEPLFRDPLDRWYDGVEDPATLKRVSAADGV
jgi:uncharacterized protein (DUF1810 family)